MRGDAPWAVLGGSLSVSPERLAAVALPGRAGVFDLALEGGRVGPITTSQQPRPAALALPGLVEPHVHADRALAGGAARPNSLEDAIARVQASKATATEDDIFERAVRLFEVAASHGVVSLRTHVDVDSVVGDKTLRAVAAARRATVDLLDVFIVAFATTQLDPASREGRRMLARAVGGEADAVGAVLPWRWDSRASIEAVLDLCVELDVHADLHVDEHLGPEVSCLEQLAERCMDRDLQGRVWASHCCALSTLPSEAARRTIAKIAEAAITMVVLPALNLYLQDRGETAPSRRGLAPIRDLLAAGVQVRIGSDNVGDVFYPYGDADPLEAAFLASIAGQVDDEDALISGVCGGRCRIEPGDRADIVLVEAASVPEALARRPPARTVLRAGAVSGPARLA